MKSRKYSRARVSVTGLVTLLAFLLYAGAAPIAFAASDWPTWPPKKAAPEAPKPGKETISEQPVKEGAPPAPVPAADAAARAGSTAGKSASAGISSGTLGWGAAILGAAVLIGVAAGGGGGSSTSSTCTP